MMTKKQSSSHLRHPSPGYAMRSLLVMFLVAGGPVLSAGCSGAQANDPAPVAPAAGQDVRMSEGEPLSPPAPEENSEPAPDEAESPTDSSDDQIDGAEGEWDAEDEEDATDTSYDDEENGSDEEEY